GVIIPGIRISMEVLESRTSKLPSVEIVRTEHVIGRGTVESIQSGLYHGTLGSVKELVQGIQNEAFGGKEPVVIGTGGFASLFENAKIFTEEKPDLVLQGLYLALKMNL
ncbi:MAG: type III pantothenate kinase, partial [Bdellovibrionales bacterium]|nr:type III pantothenate kinase [Bdellovibrionales bacterium]